jgi:AmmeMemoRadiSam system protein B
MRFGLTRKNFETPFGVVETDQEFLDSLTRRLGDDYFTDEFSHRAEHSVEFQAVCLQYLFAGRAGIRIVPILVGSFHDLFESGKLRSGDPQIAAMVDALNSTIAELPGGTCVIAAADLAHVGRRFGDPDGPTVASLRDVERDDRAMLDRVAAGDAEGVLQSIAADNDRRHVCGYPPIYMMLRCLDGARGSLLQYRQWSDLQAGAAVTFASMAMY